MKEVMLIAGALVSLYFIAEHYGLKARVKALEIQLRLYFSAEVKSVESEFKTKVASEGKSL